MHAVQTSKFDVSKWHVRMAKDYRPATFFY